VPERRVSHFAIYLLNISNSGMMAEYRVRIGGFRVYVKVLNLNLIATLTGQEIGKGIFGTILEKSVATQEFVAKVQRKKITTEGVEDAVREVAINKLCSVLGIGPAVETRIPFDLIVYDNAVQFHLEKCERCSNELLYKHKKQFAKDLK
jgi:hypothetical protein